MSPNLSPALKPLREDPCTQARVAAQALSLHTHSYWNYPVYLYYYTLVQLHEVLCQEGRGPGRWLKGGGQGLRRAVHRGGAHGQGPAPKWGAWGALRSRMVARNNGFCGAGDFVLGI